MLSMGEAGKKWPRSENVPQTDSVVTMTGHSLRSTELPITDEVLKGRITSENL